MSVLDIVWLDEQRASRAELVGNKAARLAQLRATGFAVPSGFVVACGRRAVLGHSHLAVALRSALIDSLLLLEGPWAVRSSTSLEDSSRSFAGIFRSHVPVTSASDVATAAEDVVQSAFDTNLACYVEALGVDLSSLRVSLLVQTAVAAVASGVAFTRDPVLGRQVTIIETIRGLGGDLVSGKVAPETHQVAYGRVDVLRRGGPEPLLSDEDSSRIAEVAGQIERHFGVPQDIEWAIDAGGNIHILQARPITA